MSAKEVRMVELARKACVESFKKYVASLGDLINILNRAFEGINNSLSTLKEKREGMVPASESDLTAVQEYIETISELKGLNIAQLETILRDVLNVCNNFKDLCTYPGLQVKSGDKRGLDVYWPDLVELHNTLIGMLKEVLRSKVSLNLHT